MKQLFYICILVLITISGCSTTRGMNDDHELIDGINISQKEYNSKIKLTTFPGSENSNVNGDDLVFIISNISNQPVIFPYDFGIKIYQRDEDLWIPVNNNFSYGIEDTQYRLLPQKQYPAGQVLPVMPFIPELTSTTTIRVVVIGHLEADLSKIVGAYIDVPLMPNP